ncbi:MAG TPA: caspase family protein [Anaerolineales bacterium]|nr:caspase family protein [Anaerolineales bacterium]
MKRLDNTHALVVGIANYQHINKLPPTVLKDAQDVYDLLVDPAHCGYIPDNVQLLLDDQATQSALRQALANLANHSHSDATVLIYISSHGGRIDSGSHAGEYLLPVDVAFTAGQSVAETAISGNEFTLALRAIPARKVLVIFDCCHAGGIGQPKNASAPVIKAGLPDGYYDALAAGRGRVILASSRNTEYSWVLPGADNSLFTQHLLAGLRGGIPSDDGLIRIFDLFEYLQPRVTADQPNQHPIFKAELEENFPVGLYLGGEKSVVPKDEEGFRYDAYISYVDREPDAGWVWDTLKPRLEDAGLRVAVSCDVEAPGVARVVNIERGITQSKRTIVVLSEMYLENNLANFEAVLGQSMDVQEGTYRLLPVKIAPIDERRLPRRLSMLTTLDLIHPYRSEREFDRLIQALQGALPRR